MSAHTVRLVGSALSDPYLAYAAGMNGLAGPLHGLANQEVLKFLRELQGELGNRDVTNEELAAHCHAILKAGRVIPGYGHAVLRYPFYYILLSLQSFIPSIFYPFILILFLPRVLF